MPPKNVITLANAGRKLTGPPEGYGRRKELQIKQWLTLATPAETSTADDSLEPVQSPKELDDEVHQLYHQLRDSSDGALYLPLATPKGQDARPMPPFPETPNTPITTPFTPNQPSQPSHPTSSPPAKQPPALPPTAPAPPTGKTPTTNPATLVVAHSMSIGNNPTYDMDPDPDPERRPVILAAPSPTPSNQQRPMPHPSSHTSHTNPALPSPHTASPMAVSLSASTKPLEFVLDSHQQWPQAVAIEAGLLLAKLEASKAPGTSEVAVLKLALQAAIADKHQHLQDVQVELTAARQGAAAAQQEAQHWAAQVQSREQQAVVAEQKLKAMQDQLQQKRQSLEVQNQDMGGQLAALQAALAETTEKLQQQAATHQSEASELRARAQQLHKAAADADQELVRLRTHSSVERSRMEAELAELRQGRARLEADLAAAADKLRSMEGRVCEEAAARAAAEKGERAALEALEAHAAVQAELQAARQGTASLQQRASTTAARTAAAMLPDPVQAASTVAAAPSTSTTTTSTATATGAAAAKGQRPTRPTSAASRLSPGPRTRPQAATPHRQSTPPRPASASPAAESSPCRSNAPLPPARRSSQTSPAPSRSPSHSPTRQRESAPRQHLGARAPSAPPRTPCEPEQTTLRSKPLRAMHQVLANDRKALVEAQRLQRRAQAQAELEESRQLDDALAAAPEPLRTAGLAFRAYLIPASPSSTPFATTLAAALSTCYRMFLDPLPLAGQDPSTPPAGALLPLAAAVILIADTPACLTHPSRLEELHRAALRNTPLILICPPTIPSPSAILPPAPTPAPDSTLLAYLATAWDTRIPLPITTASTNTPGTVPAATADAVAAQLGLPDADIALLPPSALKRLVKTPHPDFRHLNSPTLTTLTLFPPQPPSAPRTPPTPFKDPPLALLRALAANTTLQSLTLPSTPAVAEALATALLSAPSSAILTITVSTQPLPLAALLGRNQPPLTLLDLSHSPLTPEDAAALSILLPNAPALTDILLPPTTALPPYLTSQLAAALSSTPTLTSINQTPLATLFAPSTPILDLSSTPLGSIGAAAVLHRLATSPITPLLVTLRGINLTGCGLGAPAAPLLATLLSTPHPPPNLRALCLGDNHLGPIGAAAVLSALTKPPSRPTLGLLELSVNSLGDDGCRALATPLSALPSLERLALASNNISPDGMRALAPSLSSLTRLADLQLSGNVLGDAGATALAAVLPALANLQSLSLAENYNIGPDGARALAAWLGASTSMTALRLAKNSLGVEGARHLAGGLRTNCSLKCLDLEWCKLRAEGLEHIAGGLGVNTTLQELLLSRNAVGDRGVKALVEQLAEGGGQSLAVLDLRGNNIGLTGCRLLNGLLQDRSCRLVSLRMEKNSADEPVLRALEELAAAPRKEGTRPSIRAASPSPAARATTPSRTPPSSRSPSSHPSTPARTSAAAAAAKLSPASSTSAAPRRSISKAPSPTPTPPATSKAPSPTPSPPGSLHSSQTLGSSRPGAATSRGHGIPAANPGPAAGAASIHATIAGQAASSTGGITGEAEPSSMEGLGLGHRNGAQVAPQLQVGLGAPSADRALGTSSGAASTDVVKEIGAGLGAEAASAMDLLDGYHSGEGVLGGAGSRREKSGLEHGAVGSRSGGSREGMGGAPVVSMEQEPLEDLLRRYRTGGTDGVGA